MDLIAEPREPAEREGRRQQAEAKGRGDERSASRLESR
jgi:hypothetical protein